MADPDAIANLTLRRATTADIPQLVALADAAGTAGHWSERQYQSILDPTALEPASPNSRFTLVAESQTEVLGFLMASHISPEWELENIVVSNAFRGKGIATRLMNELIAHARHSHSSSIFLEVRESNRAARALYAKLGFCQTGRRKSYYSQPSEDAVLYRLDLTRISS